MKPNRQFAWWLPLGLLLGVGSPVRAADWSGVAADNLALTEYSPQDANPILETHIRRLSVDYEERGFFRIGILPLLAVDDVQIHVLTPAGCQQLGAATQLWEMRTSVRHRVELRGVDIYLPGFGNPHLHAALARPGATDAWELTSVSLAVAAHPPLTFAKATLQVAGADAGRLEVGTGGRRQTFLLFTLNQPNRTP